MQVLRIKFRNCLSEEVPATADISDPLLTVKVVAITFG
jgi:hypothetical protein